MDFLLLTLISQNFSQNPAWCVVLQHGNELRWPPLSTPLL